MELNEVKRRMSAGELYQCDDKFYRGNKEITDVFE